MCSLDAHPLAILALPMVLITFFLSLTGRFPAHKRLARWTFPIWLYVSVSGVYVYLCRQSSVLTPSAFAFSFACHSVAQCLSFRNEAFVIP